MQLGEKMSKGVRLVSPEDSIQKAASLMRDHDCGALPDRKDDRLVGVNTDRDIAVLVVAEGKPANKCTVGEVMIREKPLVSLLSRFSLLRHGGQAAGNALKRISRPA